MLLSLMILKIAFLGLISFLVSYACTPILTHFLYKYNLRDQIKPNIGSPIYRKLHQAKEGTPTMGGILIWVVVFLLTVGLYKISVYWPQSRISSLNFLSREQTLLPLGAFMAAAIVGLFDDYLSVRGVGFKNAGIRFRKKALIYLAIGLMVSYWFYIKLNWHILHLPFLGTYDIGWLAIPLYTLVIFSTSFAANETDGLDGLAAGVLLTNFTVFAAFAFMLNKFDLAALSVVVAGSLLSFLWFNVPPARFFMGDTGSMALGTLLGVMALLTNTVLILPLTGMVLVIEALSFLIQVTSKKLWKRKVFISAPIHHHLEALGWGEAKIVMRFWIISAVFSVVGMLVFLADKTFSFNI